MEGHTPNGCLHQWYTDYNFKVGRHFLVNGELQVCNAWRHFPFYNLSSSAKKHLPRGDSRINAGVSYDKCL